MARITVEDCMENVQNRFHLVRMASIRAKQLKKGALPLLSADGNKIAVMSLREIAAGLVTAAEEPPTERYVESAAVESTESTAAVSVEAPLAAATVQPEKTRV